MLDGELTKRERAGRRQPGVLVMAVVPALLGLACQSAPGPEPARERAEAFEVGPAPSPKVTRSGHTATLLADGTLLLSGGASLGGGALSSAELYDPRTGESSAVGSMTLARTGHSAVLLKSGKVLLVGGANASAQAELYDPVSRTFAPAATAAKVRRYQTATLLTSGKVLVLGGMDGSSPLASAELYDPVSDSFTAAASMSNARALHASSLLPNGKVLVVGGTNAPDIEIYDPGANVFSKLPTTTLGLEGPSATLLPSGKVLVAHGASFTGSEAFALDPSTGAMTPAPFSDKRVFHSASLTPSGAVLIAGGEYLPCAPNCNIGPVKSAYTLDSQTLAVTQTSLAKTRTRHTATLLPTGNTLLVGGGAGAEHYLLSGAGFGQTTSLGPTERDTACSGLLLPGGKVLLYSPAAVTLFDSATGQTSSAGKPSVTRAGAPLVLLRDGKALIAGGVAGTTYHASAEVFEPQSGSFGLVQGVMTTPRSGHSLTLLPSGKVLVVGGRDASGTLPTAELYDPVADAFAATGSLSAARHGHGALLLASGLVLITGGRDGTNQPLESAELYDPTLGKFEVVGNMGVARAGHTSTLLASGQVLVLGGATSSAFSEIYDPTTRTFSPSADFLLATFQHTATLLPFGQVLIAGGNQQFVGVATNKLVVHDPAAPSELRASGMLPGARYGHAAVLLPSGALLFARGNDNYGCGSCPPPYPGEVPPELYGLLWKDGLDDSRRPKLLSAPSKVVAGASVSLTGVGLTGGSEASGGGSNASATNYPIAVWQPLTGQGLVYGSITEWTDTSATWTPPATALHGRGLLRVITNGIPSAGLEVELMPAPLAIACRDDAACASGHCADGVCCDSACDGACEACTAALKGSGADGTCGVVPYGLSESDDCFKIDGQKCDGADECLSGHCVDGRCCNGPCTGQCEACDAPGDLGQCVAIAGAPHGARSACAPAPAGAPCAARACDAVDRSSCKGWVGAEVECASASCSEGVAYLAAACDGNGACPARIEKSCAPNGCAGDSCAGGVCESDADCHPDYRCAKALGASKGACVLSNATECDGDHTLVSADGSVLDCAPYRCTSAGTCGTSCASSLDCTRGYACSAAGVCVEDSGQSAAEAACGCVVPGAPGRAKPWAALLLALYCASRRRRSSRSSR